MRKKALEFAGALGHEPADKRLEILRRVGEVGSISQAAREAGVSYKAAWQALDTLSNLAGTALVERAVGGAGGGGARLTSAGQQLLDAAKELSRARDQVLARVAAKGAEPALARLGLRTSMRNQLVASVESVRAKAGAMRVQVRLAGGQVLVARITRESAQLLGLAAGLSVLALCKATAVEIAHQAPSENSDNVLHGTVTRAARGAGEIALALEGGQHLVGFAEAGHGLRRGLPAIARLSESAVVIALAT